MLQIIYCLAPSTFQTLKNILIIFPFFPINVFLCTSLALLLLFDSFMNLNCAVFNKKIRII